MSEGKYLRFGAGKDFSDIASRAPSMREGKTNSDGTSSKFEKRLWLFKGYSLKSKQ